MTTKNELPPSGSPVTDAIALLRERGAALGKANQTMSDGVCLLRATVRQIWVVPE